MKSGKGKKLALALMVVAVPVVIFALKDFAREEWYIYRLRHGDDAARAAAAARLADLGCFRAIPDLLEETLRDEGLSWFLWRHWAPDWSGPRRPLKKLIRKEGVPEILPILEAASVEERAWAAWVLGILGPAHPSVLPGLAHALKDPSPEVRAVSASVLWTFGPQAVPLLAGALEDHSADVRKWAAYSLAPYVGSCPEAIAALEPCLRDAEPDVRAVVFRALERSIPGFSADVAALLFELIQSEQPSWTLELLEAIASTTYPFVAPECAAVKAPSTAEDYLSPEESAQAFRSSWERILEVLRAAGTRAVPHVLHALEKSHADDARCLAEALDATVGPESQEAVPALADLAAGPDEDAQFWALCALSKIGPKASAAVPAIRKALGSLSPIIRAKAARALASMGPGGRGAAKDLEPLLEDEDCVVRVWAACALGMMHLQREARISFLSGQIFEGDTATRMEAADALVLLHPGALQVLDELREREEDEDFRVELDLARKSAMASLLDQGRTGQEAVLAELERLVEQLRSLQGTRSSEEPPDGPWARLDEALETLGPRIASWPHELVPRLRDVLVAAPPRAVDEWGTEVWENTSLDWLERLGLGGLSARELLARWRSLGHLTFCQLRALGNAAGGGDVLKDIVRSEEDHAARCAAVEALGTAGAKAVPFLVELLGDPDEEIRQAAAETLGRMGPDAGEAFEALLEAWRREEGEASYAALRASWMVRNPMGGTGPRDTHKPFDF